MEPFLWRSTQNELAEMLKPCVCQRVWNPVAPLLTLKRFWMEWQLPIINSTCESFALNRIGTKSTNQFLFTTVKISSILMTRDTSKTSQETAYRHLSDYKRVANEYRLIKCNAFIHTVIAERFTHRYISTSQNLTKLDA